MVERGPAHLWSMRALFLALCGVLMFLRLMPLDTLPRGWAGPDLIVALTLAWSLRRPEYVPPLLIAAVILLTDLLFQRPPGLWAALVLIGSQALKARAQNLRDLTFMMEWASVATTLVAMTLGFRMVLGITLVDQAPLGLSLMELVATLLAYPAVVFVSHFALGVRKAAPGDLDAMRPRA
ncbi:rod shape-determining protein MreD [Roseovarius amoyensis]|uniref:rod shape-determining protein MreD n=1 Tax=Roseovarius amoyensis TaxID=2211448 RepID=UPI000DBE0056|nr:rod shape-determining protein MreD [Roseovarius amoyensis]